VSLDITGLQADTLAISGNRIVQPPLRLERVAEVYVRVGVVGLEPDRLAAHCDGLVVLSLLR
jgi:hypothetical protein